MRSFITLAILYTGFTAALPVPQLGDVTGIVSQVETELDELVSGSGLGLRANPVSAALTEVEQTLGGLGDKLNIPGTSEVTNLVTATEGEVEGALKQLGLRDVVSDAFSEVDATVNGLASQLGLGDVPAVGQVVSKVEGAVEGVASQLGVRGEVVTDLADDINSTVDGLTKKLGLNIPDNNPVGNVVSELESALEGAAGSLGLRDAVSDAVTEVDQTVNGLGSQLNLPNIPAVGQTLSKVEGAIEGLASQLGVRDDVVTDLFNDINATVDGVTKDLGLDIPDNNVVGNVVSEVESTVEGVASAVGL